MAEIFLNRRGLSEYISVLEIAAAAMSADLQRVAKIVGLEIDCDSIMDSYMALAKGPTIFERVLIASGDIKEDACRENHRMKRLFQRLESLEFQKEEAASNGR